MLKTFLANISIVLTLSFCHLHASAADLIETAAAASNFKTFLSAAKTAALTDTLKSSGPYTLFLPSDQAFAKLPEGTLTALMKDKTRLTQVLSYHIIPGKILITDIKPGQTATLASEMVKLTSDNGIVTINGARVIQSDLNADNGVIHEIDAVLIPQ